MKRFDINSAYIKWVLHLEFCSKLFSIFIFRALTKISLPINIFKHETFEEGREILENQLKNGRENILGIVKCIVKSKTEILHSFIPEKDVNGKLNFFNVRLRKQICTLSLNILKEIYFSHEYEIEIIEVILFESIQCELLQRFAKEIIKMRHNILSMYMFPVSLCPFD